MIAFVYVRDYRVTPGGGGMMQNKLVRSSKNDAICVL